MVTTGGLEPPLDRLSTCCLCPIGLHGHGPSGWTRTTTPRVKGPVCCADTTEGDWSRHAGSNRDLFLTKEPCCPLTPWRLERVAGLEPASSGWKPEVLPLDDTRVWFGLRVSIPLLHAGNVACVQHTQAEPRTGEDSADPSTTSFDCQRTRSCEHSSRLDVRAQRGSSVERPVETAPGLEPGPARLGVPDARPLHHAALIKLLTSASGDTPPLQPWPPLLAVRHKTKGLLGGHPRRP